MNRSTVLAAAMVLGLAFHAHAKTYTPVFTEDFEYDDLWNAHVQYGTVSNAYFNMATTNLGGDAYQLSQGKRTLADGVSTTKFYQQASSNNQKRNSAFVIPDSVLNGLGNDYMLEFDLGFNAPYTKNSSPDYRAGLSVNDANGLPLLTIGTVYGNGDGEKTTGYIYRGDDVDDALASNFRVTGRNQAITNSVYAKNWLHVKLTVSGTCLLATASLADGTVLCTDAFVSDGIVSPVKYLGLRSWSNMADPAARCGLDNIVVSKGVAQTFAWTGDAGDNKWSTPGNWTVDGVAQTESCPVIGDTVSGVDSSVLAALDVAVKLVAEDGLTRVAVIADKTQKTWVAQGADTRWTTLANWAYTQGGFTVYEAPARGDTLTFPASLPDGTEVSFSGNVGDDDQNNGYALVVDGNVAFVSTSSEQRSLYSVASVSGSGVLSLDNVRLRTMLYKTLSITCNISADGSAGLLLRGQGAKVDLSGTLSGSGTLKLDADTNGNHSFTLTGDMSGFAGTLEIPQVIRNNAAGCSYSFNGDDSTIDLSGATVSIADPMTMTLGGTYSEDALKIGALTGAGTINNNTSDAMTLVLGNDETDAESSVVLAVKDGTGAWTVAKSGSNTQVLSEPTVVYNVSVSGGMLETAVGRAFGSVAVSGGALGFAADNAWVENTPYTLFTYSTWDNPSSAAIALDQSEVSTVHSASYDFATSGTVTLTLSEAAFVWVGGASGRWDDASNWQLVGSVGGAAPGYANKVTISGATVYAPATAELTGVTLSDSAKIALMFTDDTLTYTVPPDLAVADFIITAPYTATVSDRTFTATRAAATFTWAGGASGEWTATANWTVGGAFVATLPNDDDTASFVSTADVTVSSAARAGCVSVADSLTLHGSSSLSTTNVTAVGNGILRVADITITSPATKSVHTYLNAPVEVVAGTTNTFTVGKHNDGYKYIFFNGNLSGSGVLRLDQQKASGLASGRFRGDNSEFSGEIAVVNQTTRDITDFAGAASTSSNAVYTVYGRNDKKGNVFTTADTTYRLGALDGSVYQQSVNGYNPTGITLEIGNLNKDCAFGGDLGSNKTAIRKVGTAKLTCRASNIGDVEIVSGTYEVAANTQSGNIKFTGNGVFRSTPEASASSEIDYAKKFVGSTDFPIVFDDGDTNRTWSSAIPASNTAGFTKLGAGTLTLEQAPKYTGWTTVKAGKLIVPEGTVLDVVYGAGGALEGATINNLAFAEGAVLTVGTDSLEVPGSANVSNLTVYVADPAARGAPIVVVKATGGITGTARLAFPEGTSDKLKAKWSLKALGGTLKASSIAPFSITLR